MFEPFQISVKRIGKDKPSASNYCLAVVWRKATDCRLSAPVVCRPAGATRNSGSPKPLESSGSVLVGPDFIATRCRRPLCCPVAFARCLCPDVERIPAPSNKDPLFRGPVAHVLPHPKTAPPTRRPKPRGKGGRRRRRRVGA